MNPHNSFFEKVVKHSLLSIIIILNYCVIGNTTEVSQSLTRSTYPTVDSAIAPEAAPVGDPITATIIAPAIVPPQVSSSSSSETVDFRDKVSSILQARTSLSKYVQMEVPQKNISLSSIYERSGSELSEGIALFTKEMIKNAIMNNWPAEYLKNAGGLPSSLDHCYLVRWSCTKNELLQLYNLANTSINIDKNSNNISIPFSYAYPNQICVVCYDGLSVSSADTFVKFLMTIGISPTIYDLIEGTKYTGKSDNSHAKTNRSTNNILNFQNKNSTPQYTDKELISIEEVINYNEFLSNQKLNFRPSILKDTIYHAVNGLFNPVVKVPITYRPLLEKLGIYLKQINIINPSIDYSALSQIHLSIFDLITAILSVATPTFYEHGSFSKIITETYQKRLYVITGNNYFDVKSKSSSKTGIQNTNYLTSSGMESLFHAIYGCHTLVRNNDRPSFAISLPLGTDIKKQFALKVISPNSLPESIYYELDKTNLGVVNYSQIFLSSSFPSTLSSTALSSVSSSSTYSLSPSSLSTSSSTSAPINYADIDLIVTGLTSNINEKAEYLPALVNFIKETVKQKRDNNYLTVVIDNSIEIDPAINPTNQLLVALKTLIAEGKINFIITKSLQKYFTLGTGKVRGGLISAFNNGDKKFNLCLDYLKRKITPISSTEQQFLTHLMKHNHLAHDDEINLISTASKNAKIISDLYSESKKLTPLAPVKNNAFLHFCKYHEDFAFKGLNKPTFIQVLGSASFAFSETSQTKLLFNNANLSEEICRVSMGYEPANILYEKFYVGKILAQAQQQTMTSVERASEMASTRSSASSYASTTRSDLSNGDAIKINLWNNILASLMLECQNLNSSNETLAPKVASLQQPSDQSNSSSDDKLSNAKRSSIIWYVHQTLLGKYLNIYYTRFCQNQKNLQMFSGPGFLSSTTKVPSNLPDFFTNSLKAIKNIYNSCKIYPNQGNISRQGLASISALNHFFNDLFPNNSTIEASCTSPFYEIFNSYFPAAYPSSIKSDILDDIFNNNFIDSY